MKSQSPKPPNAKKNWLARDVSFTLSPLVLPAAAIWPSLSLRPFRTNWLYLPTAFWILKTVRLCRHVICLQLDQPINSKSAVRRFFREPQARASLTSVRLQFSTRAHGVFACPLYTHTNLSPYIRAPVATAAFKENSFLFRSARVFLF